LNDTPPDKKIYPPNAIHMVRTTQQIHVQLSAMADHKASILMGATFVIFTITIGQARAASPPIALLILGAAAFFSAVFRRARDPARHPLQELGADQPALLRLVHAPAPGRISGCPDRAAQRRRKHLPHHGAGHLPEWPGAGAQEVPMLGYAYRIFLAGLTASFIAFLIEMAMWH
jgi:hypothetical protein